MEPPSWSDGGSPLRAGSSRQPVLGSVAAGVRDRQRQAGCLASKGCRFPSNPAVWSLPAALVLHASGSRLWRSSSRPAVGARQNPASASPSTAGIPGRSSPLRACPAPKGCTSTGRGGRRMSASTSNRLLSVALAASSARLWLAAGRQRNRPMWVPPKAKTTPTTPTTLQTPPFPAEAGEVQRHRGDRIASGPLRSTHVDAGWG